MTHILIIAARFYPNIADELVKGATAALKKEGTTYEVVDVPGVFEIPAAIAMAAKTKRYEGYVALGCVIRGETSHYDVVCNESARGLQELAIRKKLAIGNGILTVENREQAWARAGIDKKNKGAGAAEACLTMINLRKQFAITRTHKEQN